MVIFAIVGCSCVWTLYTPSQSSYSKFESRSLFQMDMNQQLIVRDVYPSNVNRDRLGSGILMGCEGGAMRATRMHIAKASHNG